MTQSELNGIMDFLPEGMSGRWLRVMERDGLIDVEGATSDDATLTLTTNGIDLMRRTVIAAGAAEKRVRDDEEIGFNGGLAAQN